MSRLSGALVLAAFALLPACDSAKVRLPSAALSLVSFDPATIVADGATASTVSITLVDAAGTPIVGAVAELTVDGGGIVITQPTAPSGLDGVVTAAITATASGERAFRVSVTTRGQITTFTLPAVLAVTPGAPDAAHSSVTLSAANVPADGATSSTITVTARDSFDNPIPDADVAVQINSPTAALGATSLTTDSNGSAQTQLSSRQIEIVTVQATLTVDANNVVVTEQPAVTFVRPATLEESEPNDDPAEANLLWLDTVAYGSVVDQEDVDTFAIDMQVGEAIEIELFATRFDQATWAQNSNVPRLTVWDATGATKLVEHDYSGNFSVEPWYWSAPDFDLPLFRADTTGVHLITVTCDDSGSGGGAYALRIRSRDMTNVVGEGTTIVGASEIYGFHDDDDVDDYPLVTIAPSFVRAEVLAYRLGVNHRNASTPDYFDPALELTTAGPSLTGGSTIYADDELFYDPGLRAFLDAGTYTYSVRECCGSADAPYLTQVTITPFTGTTETEPNDSNGTATLMPAGVMVMGATTNTDPDVFAIELTAGDVLRLECLGAFQMLPNQGANVNLTIQDPNDTIVVSTTTFMPHVEILATVTGTWHVQMDGTSGTPTGYLLQANIESIVAETEPNNDVATANGFLSTDGMCGTIADAGDVDFFRVSASAKDELVHLVLICPHGEYTPNTNVQGLRSELVASLVIRDAEGNVICTTDGDVSPYPTGIAHPEAGCEIVFRAPAAGTYYVNVADANGNGGAARFYVLRRQD